MKLILFLLLSFLLLKNAHATPPCDTMRPLSVTYISLIYPDAMTARHDAIQPQKLTAKVFFSLLLQALQFPLFLLVFGWLATLKANEKNN